MTFLDTLAEGYFKTMPSGTILFYPQGVPGKGYILPTIEKKRAAVQAVKRLWIAIFSLPLVSGVSSVLTHQWLYSIIIYLVLAAPLLLWWRVTSAKLVQGLEQSEIRLSMRESYRNSHAKEFIIWLVVFALIVMILFMAITFILMAAFFFRAV